MKIKNIFIWLILVFLVVNQAIANERKTMLDRLFKELKINNSLKTFEVEKKIWKIWSTHPQKENLTLMLFEGSDLINDNRLNEAVNLFYVFILKEVLCIEY